MIRVLDGLYLGNREDARDLRRLTEAGVTHVVNCAHELPNYHEGRFHYLALQLRDPDPGMIDCFDHAWRFIDEGRAQKGAVLVHCVAAVSRSPTVVLSYLCHLGATLEEAAGRLGGRLDRPGLAVPAAAYGPSGGGVHCRAVDAAELYASGPAGRMIG